MDAREAEEQLEGLPLVPAMAGSITDMKALRERCLAAGIAALVGCPPGAGKGWGTKTHLLVQEDDLEALGQLLRGDWRASLEREGLAPVALEMTGDELPCPACGTAAPLVEGACSDCGLQLE